MTAFNGPVSSRFGSRFLPKSAASRGLLYVCMGSFSIFCPGPRRDAMGAGKGLEVAAVAVIGLLLVWTLPGPTGSR